MEDDDQHGNRHDGSKGFFYAVDHCRSRSTGWGTVRKKSNVGVILHNFFGLASLYGFLLRAAASAIADERAGDGAQRNPRVHNETLTFLRIDMF